jgi:integrase/recombinase XerD
MKPGELVVRLEGYLALQQTLGFALKPRERLLRDFVSFADRQAEPGPVTAQTALDWACATSARCGATGRAGRLSVARQFLLHLSALVPGTEVPSAGLLARARRPKPFLFSSVEIQTLLMAAGKLKPANSLRPHTMQTILGLLASTGLRPSEAVRLEVGDVALDADPPRLLVRQTKFRKSRFVPLHDSAAARMRQYVQRRSDLHYDGLADAFFVSEQGRHLHFAALSRCFRHLMSELGLAARDGSRSPSLHSLRHTFAVSRLRKWQDEGADVPACVPHLAVYLGHAAIEDTYWYLTATPELLTTAGHLFAVQAGCEEAL